MDISDYRREYTQKGLARKDLHATPFEQFSLWFEQADQVDIIDCNAMTLATASPDGKPSARTVLLKSFDENGFVFYTNYASQKAQEIEANPYVALLFPWTGLERQIEITGKAERVSIDESNNYFLSRPEGSQIGAWASRQSAAIDSRQVLLDRQEKLEKRFTETEIPAPDFWGGYRVIPERVEFWQGRVNRLHDRFEYIRDGHNWKIQRLAP